MLNIANLSRQLLITKCYCRRIATVLKCNFSDCYSKYTEEEKSKILEVINQSDLKTFSSYEISKGSLKKISKFRSSNGQLNSLPDIEQIEGITKKSAAKLFDSILKGPNNDKDTSISSKIKGQFLHPALTQTAIKECQSVLSIYVTAHCVCWIHVNKSNYEVTEWKYHGIDYPESKRLQITDIVNIAWCIIQQLPRAEIYVMKAEATTLRAAGNDPTNPKVLAINLQKSQMISMLVALLTARSNLQSGKEESEKDGLKQSVYFLRPTLPYRLYGTLVGTEKVSTEQTVDMLLNDLKDVSSNNSHAYIPDHLQEKFRSQRDLAKDMLGHCLLLSLTFMDLCIYKNKDRISKLLTRNTRCDE